jgi:hypothetical protein
MMKPQNSKQVSQWAGLLFKCIKPSTDTEFSINGDVGKLHKMIFILRLNIHHGEGIYF